MKINLRSDSLFFPKVMLVAVVPHYFCFLFTIWLILNTPNFHPLTVIGTYVVLSVLFGIPYLLACVGGVVVYVGRMLAGDNKFNEIATLVFGAAIFTITFVLEAFLLLFSSQVP